MYEFVAESVQQIALEHNQANSIEQIEKIAYKWMGKIDRECEIKYEYDDDGLEQSIISGEINLKRRIIGELKKELTPLLTITEWNSLERIVGTNRRRKRIKSPRLFSYLKLDSVTSNAIKDKAQERLRERQEEYITIDTTQLIEHAVSELNESSWYRRLLALMLLTGRRPYEVARTAQLTCNDDVIIFHGQIKGKGGKPVRDGYAIPLLAPYEIIITALDKLRVDKKDIVKLTSAQFNSRCAKQYGEAFTKYWRSLFPQMDDLTPYALRRVYAAICYERYGGRKMPTSYMASILGHSDTDVHTALHYIQFVSK